MTAAFTEPGFTHAKYGRFSTLTTAPYWAQSLVYGVAQSYTEDSKSKSFRLVARNPEHPLHPLLEGRCVVLLMETPPSGKRPPGAPTIKPTPVVLTPGSLFGSAQNVLLVSVVGKGATVVKVGADQQQPRLVLAGVPKRLAYALMDQLRRTFFGDRHGTPCT